jgi:hypothetical protein
MPPGGRLGGLGGERRRPLPALDVSARVAESSLVGGRGELMHAIVVKATLNDFEQARTFLRQHGVPNVRGAPGFVTAHWVRLSENSGTSMLVFESEKAAQSAAEQLGKNPPPTDALTIDSVEIGEVVEHAS